MIDLSTIRNCLICNNYIAYLPPRGYGGVWVAGNTCTVQNCTIVSNEGGGLNSSAGAAGGTNTIKNTIMYFNNGSNFYGSACFVSNCCFAPTSSVPAATSGMNIESDPQFKDRASGNYWLSANSPCINSGTNEDWMTTAVDLDGKQRIRYDIVDVGAFETIYEGTIYRFGF